VNKNIFWLYCQILRNFEAGVNAPKMALKSKNTSFKKYVFKIA
jgi:hypothetical protein